MSATILIVDDEAQIRRVVRNAVGGADVEVLEASTGGEALDLAAARLPSLVVLDLGLPDMPGERVCRELRKWSTAPIVVLSAHHSESEKVGLLDAGADDYVGKPFSPTELQARVRAQLRRAAMGKTAGDTGPIQCDGLSIDVARRVVTRDGAEVHLTPTEWDLLRTFVRYAGRTLSHQHIFREVWRDPAGDAQAYLRVHIANLRRKLERDPVRPLFLVTEPGVGYRFRALD